VRSTETILRFGRFNTPIAKNEPMSDTSWLVVAIVAGTLLVVGWVSRELAIHRRRRQRSQSR
jgi:hypothetical protein